MRRGWTKAELDVLERCLRAGFSATEIARHMTIEFQRVYSRSKIVGKAARSFGHIGFARRPGRQDARRGRALRTAPLLPDLAENTCRFPVSGEGAATRYCAAPVADAADPHNCMCRTHRFAVYRKAA